MNNVYALAAALVLSLMLATGCSTPPVSGSLYKDSAPSMSFSNCLQVMTSAGLQYQCQSTSTATTYSYNQYVGHLTGVTEQQKIAAYANYLSALDEDSRAELAAKFDEVSQQSM